MNRKYRKTVIAGNWKMNKLASEAKPFVEELRAAMPKTKTCESVLCVPFPIIPAMAKVMRDSRLAFGAQDVSAHESGAYTGEVSAAMLADLGVKYCIVGHSERRQYHGETDSAVNVKAKALLDDLRPKVFLPMHYRMGAVGLPAVGQVEDFLSLVENYVYYPTDTLSLDEGTKPQIAVLHCSV